MSFTLITVYLMLVFNIVLRLGIAKIQHNHLPRRNIASLVNKTHKSDRECIIETGHIVRDLTHVYVSTITVLAKQCSINIVSNFVFQRNNISDNMVK